MEEQAPPPSSVCNKWLVCSNTSGFISVLTVPPFNSPIITLKPIWSRLYFRSSMDSLWYCWKLPIFQDFVFHPSALLNTPDTLSVTLLLVLLPHFYLTSSPLPALSLYLTLTIQRSCQRSDNGVWSHLNTAAPACTRPLCLH